MFPLGQIIPNVINGMLRAVFDPLFWVVVALVALQYRRMAGIKESFTGIKAGAGVFKDTLVAVGFGLAGGFAGSLLMILLGLTLSGSGLAYLWPLAIFLMLINPRFLCFAYAGGILALTHLLFGFPRINVPQVIALVAVLHMVESLLILGSGHLGAVPTYFKSRSGRLVGGFSLQKFWPIPIVALLVVGQDFTHQGIDMPSWWPLIKPGGGDYEHLVYSLLPVVAGLGYGDLALARTPREKSRLSALFLGVYSLVLLILALWAGQSRLFALLAALFSPLGHELVIYIGRQMEFNNRPLYVPAGRGLVVLDAVPNTPAWKAGIRSGDTVVEINGCPVGDKASLEQALKTAFYALEITFLKHGEGRCRREVVHPAPGQPLGILPVPEEGEPVYAEMNTGSLLGRWLRAVRKKISG